MKASTSVLVLVLSAPSLAAAQDLSGGVTLGFGDHDISEFSQGLSTTTLDGRMKLAFDNGLTLGVSAGYIDVGIDEVPFDFQGDFIGLDLGYRFANGMALGVYVEDLTLSTDALPIDLSLRTVGLSGSYSMEGLEFGAFIGNTTTSPDIGLLLDADVNNFGLTAKYAAMPNLDIAGAFLRATIDTSGTDVDIHLIGLAASYDINEQFSVFGGLSRTSVDLADLDVTTMGLGVGYDLTGMMGMASNVSLELARSDLSLGGDSADLDTIRLGLTFPLGGAGTEAPLNSVADSIFNPRRGALNAALTGAF